MGLHDPLQRYLLLFFILIHWVIKSWRVINHVCPEYESNVLETVSMISLRNIWLLSRIDAANHPRKILPFVDAVKTPGIARSLVRFVVFHDHYFINIFCVAHLPMCCRLQIFRCSLNCHEYNNFIIVKYLNFNQNSAKYPLVQYYWWSGRNTDTNKTRLGPIWAYWCRFKCALCIKCSLSIISEDTVILHPQVNLFI
jgi:hypothetical protein